MTSKTFCPEVADKLCRWDGVYTNVEQAGFLGVTTKTVSTWRANIGIANTQRRSPEITPELDARITAMKLEGWSLQGVSEATGVYIGTLRARYPDLRMPPKEVGSLGAAVRNFNRGAKITPRTPTATGETK